LVVLGFELRISSLLVRDSTSWVSPPDSKLSYKKISLLKKVCRLPVRSNFWFCWWLKLKLKRIRTMLKVT
jgi:hypothetical protein